MYTGQIYQPGEKHLLLKHILTIDVEDWFHGIDSDVSNKLCPEPRLDYQMNILLELLLINDIKATFFWLGSVAQEYPQLLRKISQTGHEIGCQGWQHDFVYRKSNNVFREETSRSLDIITDIIGKQVISFRAPYFSITERSLWALEILTCLGFEYDSSIFPVRNWRYGIPGFGSELRKIKTSSGSIYEVPISVRKIFGITLPAGGGAYFRMYPYWLTRMNFLAAGNTGNPVLFYIHPWEFDPEHPRVMFNWKAMITHYINLESTVNKFNKLLHEFHFGALHEVAGILIKNGRFTELPLEQI